MTATRHQWRVINRLECRTEHKAKEVWFIETQAMFVGVLQPSNIEDHIRMGIAL